MSDHVQPSASDSSQSTDSSCAPTTVSVRYLLTHIGWGAVGGYAGILAIMLVHLALYMLAPSSALVTILKRTFWDVSMLACNIAPVTVGILTGVWAYRSARKIEIVQTHYRRVFLVGGAVTFVVSFLIQLGCQLAVGSCR